MRGDGYGFVLFRGGLDSPVVAARSGVVQFSTPFEPLRPRVLLTSDPTALRLQWSSPRGAQGQHVKYGTHSGVYTHTVSATTESYNYTDLCNEPATTVGWHDPGLINNAVLGNLMPQSTVYYVFGDERAVSEEHLLRVPARPGSHAATKLVAYGDMGQAALDDALQHSQEWPSLNTTRLVQEEISESNDVDIVCHIGDISYARGYSSEWDQFLDQVSPVASTVPYMISLGNHERDAPNSGSYYDGNDSGGECGVPAKKQFNTLRQSMNESWYSIEVGLVHITFMDTEIDFRDGSAQFNWIRDDLAAVNRSRTPWVIFTGHRPMYISSTNVDKPAGDQPVASLLREHVEPLLLEHRVDLGLWGHHHSGQRTCAVANMTCKQHAVGGSYKGPWIAPVHAVIGNAGQGLSTNIQNPKPQVFEFVQATTYGFSILEFVNSTFMQMTQLTSSDGTVLDKFTINRV